VKLGYSKKLRSNYLVVEEAHERSIAYIARRAEMHRAERKVGGSFRYAVVFVRAGTKVGEPEFLSRKQLENRGCAA
jgi:hypothetical protein